ncbi:MAG: MFS transporter [Pseudomonadota bacterium]
MRAASHGATPNFAERLLSIQRDEWPALALAFFYFFFLLCSYYILRPIRDEMGIAAGVSNMQWLFTGTFFAMILVMPLYGAVASRLPRRRLVPVVYYFFIANIFVFYGLFAGGIDHAWVARVFFVWVSVFNLFVVSVFWSLLVDLFTAEQARRLFGVVAAGGSAGAIAGPTITAAFAAQVGPVALLPVSAILLLCAVGCVHGLVAHVRGREAAGIHRPDPQANEPLGGSVLSGVGSVLRSPYLLGIAVFVFLYTLPGGLLYFSQASLIDGMESDPGRRTQILASIDLVVNIATIGTQLFITSFLARRFGLAFTLALIPVLGAIGIACFAIWPVLPVLVALQVVRRAGEFAITKPAREMLWSRVSDIDKYKAKNVVDTVVYRGGDVLSSWSFTLFTAAGLSLSAIALVGIPVALVWAGVGIMLGRAYRASAGQQAPRRPAVEAP